ncbi:alpha/beta fold hydrolase [Noviherbaspirillum denitrificans]|uniref:Alpha/beta hydrolase n=1 Tax=Noviherbaspirillum denitrificans TaxID=1968433 RepID=A0A254TDT4_9BURK|nr:alpha/beta hydrolase [Noviherbaspirillum denitrificans]OWW20811.1 alpha/beta hydrolase [Noviherbaspirillum denitrificans]
MTNTCVVVGKGPHKVLALHGWFGSARGWGFLPEVLDQQQFTYVFMDYRGYGGSMARKGEYSIAEIASDALELADALHWDRFSLLGHSMGGMAIQQVLLDAPERVRKLVAVTPVPPSGVPFDEGAWTLFSRAAHDKAARRAIIDMSTGNRQSGAWLDAMVAHSLEHADAEAFGAYLPAWARNDIAAQVEGNTAEIKVIVGESDPGLTADFMRATYLRCYPRAVLETMPNAGHYPMHETPVALATSIESFLRG